MRVPSRTELRHELLRAVARDDPARGGDGELDYRVQHRERRTMQLEHHLRVLRRGPTGELTPTTTSVSKTLLELFRAGLLGADGSLSATDEPARLRLTRLGYRALADWEQQTARQRRPAGRRTVADAVDQVYRRYGDALRELGHM